MLNEGSVRTDSRRHGPLAFLRHKQWWYFEGLDTEQGIYFVFLALELFPNSYVSMKIIDYKRNYRWTEERRGTFRAVKGDRVDVSVDGDWGHMRFFGQAETQWEIDIETPDIVAKVVQKPRAEQHRDWLLTRYIDYTITQFIMNEATGTLKINNKEFPFKGYGYHEHNWGIQPRHSRANWLHFWAPDMAGIVLDCHYDAGVPHHYTYLWRKGHSDYLVSPARFGFHPSRPENEWNILSADLSLDVKPIYTHRTRIKLPPIIGYINIDYYEQLVELKGTAVVHGEDLAIEGMGKFDHNFNKW